VNELLLFCSSAVMVTLLVIQSRLNIHGRNRLAAVNSVLIGLSQLVLWKIMPDANTTEVIAFIAGGPIGNIIAQRVNRSDVARIRKLHDE